MSLTSLLCKPDDPRRRTWKSGSWICTETSFRESVFLLNNYTRTVPEVHTRSSNYQTSLNNIRRSTIYTSRPRVIHDGRHERMLSSYRIQGAMRRGIRKQKHQRYRAYGAHEITIFIPAAALQWQKRNNSAQRRNFQPMEISPIWFCSACNPVLTVLDIILYLMYM